MRILAIALTLLAAQNPAPIGSLEQRTQGSCSPVVADVNGTVTITCTGMDSQSIKDLQRAVDLLQQIIANNSDKFSPVATVFPVSYFLRTNEKLPLVIPYRPFPWDFLAYFDEFLKQHPDAVTDDGYGSALYHEFLQKSLFEWVAMRFSKTWRMEFLNFETGAQYFSGLPDPPGSLKPQILTEKEVEQSFLPNRFSIFHALPGLDTFAMPPTSKLTVKVPRSLEEHGQIRISNPLFELVIDTAWSGGMRSFGEYGYLLNISPTNDSNFWSQSFIVRIDVTFNESLASDPEMPNVRKWAKDMVGGLQSAFDEQIMWKKTIEKFQVERLRVGPDLPRQLLNGLGPMKFDSKDDAASKK